MKQLVNEFRDYARLPAAQLQPLDLNALVAEVLALYGHAQEAGRLVPSCAPALPAILGDATQLRQVIHNLVQNALDAVAERPDGRVRIVTEAARSEQGARARRAAEGRRQWPGLLPTRCSSAPSSPMSRPRPRAPGSGWRW